MDTAEVGGSIDPGLKCLVILARFYGVQADAAGLQLRFPPDGGGTGHLTRVARHLGLDYREEVCAADRLSERALPMLAVMRDGGCVVLAGVDLQRVLVQWPFNAHPYLMVREEFLAQWSGRIGIVRHPAPAPDRRPPFGWSWLVAAFDRRRGLILEILLASFITQLTALFTPIGFQVVIDKVLVHQALATLDVVILGLALFAVGEAVLAGLRVCLQTHLTRSVDVALGTELFAHLLQLPAAWFERRMVGEVAAQVQEMEAIRNFFGGAALTLAIDLLFAALFLLVLFLYSRLLCAVVASATLFYVVLAVCVTPALRNRLRSRSEWNARLQSGLVESIAGMAALKSAAAEAHEQQRWSEVLAGHAASGARAAVLGGLSGQIALFINRVAGIAILWLGAREVMAGELSIGQFVAFNLIAARLNAPILRLTQSWNEFQQLRLSVSRIGELINTPGERQTHPRGQRPMRTRGALTLREVSFRYRPEYREVIRELSIDFPAGSITGIIGASGSGKSTLAKLLQGIYLPERGRILLDGMDLALLDPAWLRRTVGIVAQESFLFHRSVRDNIALSDPDMPQQGIEHAARLAGAHDFILELAHGYDTVLDERAGGLSGGQRQRIAIARALASAPRVLIFDEATSALDFESEQALIANLPYICKGRTVLIIGHRMGFLRPAERIIVLGEGRLCETGPPSVLARSGGYFARFCRQHATPGARS